jgi:hypothetical protein
MVADLDRLRAIGWAHWNPIGLDGPPETPADEYDDYLVRTAGMFAAGRTPDEVAAYLVRCVEIDMGMAPADRAAALANAAAIRSVVGGQ